MSRLFTILVLSTFSIACAHTDKLDIEHAGPAIPTELVVVGEVDFHLPGAESWNQYEKVYDLLKILDSIDGIDAVAPWEYHVINPPGTPGDLLTRSDLVPRTREMGVASEKLLLINIKVTERSQRQLTQATKKEHTSHAKSYAASILLELELTHPAGNKVIARTRREHDVDRFVDVPDYDQRPTTSRLFRTTIQNFFHRLLREGVITPSAPALPEKGIIGVKDNPQPVTTYRHNGKSLKDTLQSLDELTREARLYTRFRYFDPQMNLLEFRRWHKLPAGVTVVADTTKSKIGHHIVCANSLPITHAFQWNRTRRRTPIQTITVYEKGIRYRIDMKTGKRSAAADRCGN
ncbi:MAG TPA: hypothetical protein EYN06_09060 [Myxococcales bacterium]|nr:hypothetical protein [Myxococcales bacterium]HIN86616.1 hypothetical protein [Myxococcales bacterium]